MEAHIEGADDVLGSRYFYDVPVYRLTETAYIEQQSAYCDRNEKIIWAAAPPRDQLDETAIKSLTELSATFRRHNWLSYGGMWRFNEAIGHIRLHFSGSQIRGEYYAVKRRRIVRTRTKRFEYHTHKLAPELTLPDRMTSDAIFAKVLQYVTACRKELPRRYVDAALLETIGPHVDWLALYRTFTAPSTPARSA